MKGKGQKSGKDARREYDYKIFFVVVRVPCIYCKAIITSGSMPMITQYYGAN